MVLVALAHWPPAAAGQDVVDGYTAHELTGASGDVIRYRLFVPEDTSGGPLPLVVYLHGGGGGGTDNRAQLTLGNTVATRLFASPELQARHPAVVVAPQAPFSSLWTISSSDALNRPGQLVVELVETLIREYGLDADRVYLTGLSAGGRGTWDIARKRPDLFAAAVPSCGEGTPSKAAALHDVPVWAFHGARDATIPVEGSREMVAALRAAGGSVRYTEYPDAGHDACTFPYRDPELPEWLFQQRRGR